MGNKNSGPRTTYTQEVADEICDRIAKGEPLKQICRDDHMPDERTVRRWYVDDIGGFAPLYARARDLLLEHWADEIVNISDTTALGVETTTKGDGDVETREGDMLGHRKLQIDTRKWLLSKLRPDKYGEKLELSGDPKKPLVPVINVTIAPKPASPTQAGRGPSDDGD